MSEITNQLKSLDLGSMDDASKTLLLAAIMQKHDEVKEFSVSYNRTQSDIIRLRFNSFLFEMSPVRHGPHKWVFYRTTTTDFGGFRKVIHAVNVESFYEALILAIDWAFEYREKTSAKKRKNGPKKVLS